MTTKSDPVPMKELNDLDRQAKAAQWDGKPFKPSPYIVRCLVNELKEFRRAAGSKVRLKRRSQAAAQADYNRTMKAIIRTESRVDGDRKR